MNIILYFYNDPKMNLTVDTSLPVNCNFKYYPSMFTPVAKKEHEIVTFCNDIVRNGRSPKNKSFSSPFDLQTNEEIDYVIRKIHMREYALNIRNRSDLN